MCNLTVGSWSTAELDSVKRANTEIDCGGRVATEQARDDTRRSFGNSTDVVSHPKPLPAEPILFRRYCESVPPVAASQRMFNLANVVAAPWRVRTWRTMPAHAAEVVLPFSQHRAAVRGACRPVAPCAGPRRGDRPTLHPMVRRRKPPGSYRLLPVVGEPGCPAATRPLERKES